MAAQPFRMPGRPPRCVSKLRDNGWPGGTSGIPSFPNLPLLDESGKRNDSLVATMAWSHSPHQTVNIADAYTETNFDFFSGTRHFDRRTRLPFAVLPRCAVKKKNHDEVIGVCS
jgi:hypothetical protein